MHVLRLWSVFEAPPAALGRRAVRFDTIGGMQNHTAALTRELDRIGVRQTVITTRPPTAAAEEALGRSTRVLRVGLPVPVMRQGWGWQAAVRASTLPAAADVVHAHLGADLALLPLAVATARRHDCPLVVTVHLSMRHTLRATDPGRGLLHIVGGRLEPWGLARAAAVITLTQRLAGLLVAEGLAAERLHVIPSGVVPALFTADAGDPFPQLPRPRVTFVGRLHPEKGLGVLLRAAAALRTPGAHVLIVGDGPQRAALERAVSRRGLADRVSLVGAVPHDDVPAVLAHADVVVLPSLSEELGSVLLEVMQAGRPVVASRVGGIPEAVADGVTGLLVPPGDPAALAGAVDRLLADRPAAAAMGRAARERAGAYDWSQLARRVLDVYHGVLDEAAAASGTRQRSRA